MRTSSIASILFAAGVLAQPLHHQHAEKREIVTNVVEATKVLYQNEVVYVDQNGTPYSTGLEPASTTVRLENSQPSSAPAAQPTEAAEESSAAPSSSAAAPSSQQEPSSAPAPSSAAAQASQAAPQKAQQQQPSPSSTPETSTPPAPSSSAAPSSSSAPAPSSSSSGGSSGGSEGGNSGTAHSGEATYYAPGLGACGKTNSEDDLIAALNKDQFYSGGDAGVSNGNSNCGRKAKVTRGDKHVTVTIVDSCPGCSKGDLDLSPAAFDKIASQSEGRVDIKWSWVN